jgi:hypothetical protein
MLVKMSGGNETVNYYFNYDSSALLDVHIFGSKKNKRKNITTLSTPNTKIGGAYFWVPAHGIDSCKKLNNSSLNGGLLSKFGSRPTRGA